MADMPASAAARGLPASAIATLVVLMASWGFHFVSVKLALPDLSPPMQSLIRALVSTACLTVFMLARGERILARDATLVPGIVAGLMFGVEFLLIFGGLSLTSAARGGVLLYTMPFFVSAMAIVYLPGERLDRRQLGGMATAFVGVAIAFSDGFGGAAGPYAVVGDLLMVAAAASWAATTIVIKRTALLTAPPTRVLWYQLAMSIPVSAVAVLVSGAPAPTGLSATTLGVIAYQGVWVAFLTYIAWFALVARHSAPVLSTWSFLAPVFGMVFGHFVLGEPVGPALIAALVLISGGLVLVSRPKR